MPDAGHMLSHIKSVSTVNGHMNSLSVRTREWTCAAHQRIDQMGQRWGFCFEFTANMCQSTYVPGLTSGYKN